jgi:hypothetical protein
MVMIIFVWILEVNKCFTKIKNYINKQKRKKKGGQFPCIYLRRGKKDREKRREERRERREKEKRERRG